MTSFATAAAASGRGNCRERLRIRRSWLRGSEARPHQSDTAGPVPPLWPGNRCWMGRTLSITHAGTRSRIRADVYVLRCIILSYNIYTLVHTTLVVQIVVVGLHACVVSKRINSPVVIQIILY